MDLGIIKGLNGGLFGPYDAITRAQLALMLVRAGGAALATPPAGYSHGFVDVPSFAEEAVTVARYNGLLSGKTDELFDPYGAATRGQVAKMTSNLVERLRPLRSTVNGLPNTGGPYGPPVTFWTQGVTRRHFVAVELGQGAVTLGAK